MALITSGLRFNGLSPPTYGPNHLGVLVFQAAGRAEAVGKARSAQAVAKSTGHQKQVLNPPPSARVE